MLLPGTTVLLGCFFCHFSKEMSRVLVASLLRAVNYTSNHSTALLLSFTTFVSLVLLQGDLDLHTVSFIGYSRTSSFTSCIYVINFLTSDC